MEHIDEPIIDINEVRISSGAMFAPISIDDFLKAHKRNNPTENIKEYRAALEQTVQAKKSGAVCSQCGNPIWALGTATVGWNGCFKRQAAARKEKAGQR